MAFGIQSTPYSARVFAEKLGIELNIYETTLGNAQDIYITSFPPHLTSMISLQEARPTRYPSSDMPEKASSVSLTAHVSQTEGRITSITNRADLFSDRLKKTLSGGCIIRTTQTAPCDFILTLGEINTVVPLIFPLPVDESQSRTRIARKSSYIEVEASIFPTAWMKFPEFTTSRLKSVTTPLLMNVHALDLDLLPILDRARSKELEWLNPHVSGMFSGRERKIRANSTLSDTRTSWKDSILSLFGHYTGLQGEQTSVFGLTLPDAGGIQILIFVSCLRYDLGSQTVVLDSAVLPLTMELMPELLEFLNAITGKVRICQIKVDAEEIGLWRQLLPSLAERCRNWQHSSSCEHENATRQPTAHENQVFCSCGCGRLPEKFISGVPKFSQAIKYMTRVAISPIFSVPIVDTPFDLLAGTLSTNIEGCRVCGAKKTAEGKALLKCGKCQDAKYCSVECQRADWKQHKHTCKRQTKS